MLLTIDVGNTNTMLGLYADASLGPHWRLATEHERMPDEYAMQLISLLTYVGVDVGEIHGVALASGVPVLTTRWVEVCRRYLNAEPLVIHGRMKTGLTILYDNPDAVGADRVVDAVAAYTFYGGPLCIVDFGTATTFEAVTAAGEYLGGAIAPGIGIAAAPGRTIYLGGQIGWNGDQQFETDDFVAQMRQALENIVATLAEAGGAPEHIVRLTWFITDKAEYVSRVAELGAAYRAVMGRHFPAMSVVAVTALIEDRAKVEIEATAVIPD